MTIVYRSTKGSNLTPSEVDGNFSDLAARTDLAWAMTGSEPSVIEGNANAAELLLFRDGIYAWNYSNSQASESFASFDVPFDWAVGTDLYAAIHWSPGSSTSTGTVRWGLEYTYAKAYGGGSFGASNTIYIEQAADGTAYKHYTAFNNYADRIQGSVPEQNMRFLVRLFRDYNHVNDTFSNGAFVIGIDFYYQRSKFGTSSRTPPF